MTLRPDKNNPTPAPPPEGVSASNSEAVDTGSQLPRRTFIEATLSLVGVTAMGGQALPLAESPLADVYTSAAIRLRAAKTASDTGLAKISTTSEQISAGKAALSDELGGLQQISQQLRRQAVEGNAAQSEILKAYEQETGLKLQPLNNGLDARAQEANGVVARARKLQRDDSRALDDLKRQIEDIKQEQSDPGQTFEESCARLRALLLEPESVRVTDATLGTTTRFVVTLINHSELHGTDDHLGRKDYLQNLGRDVIEATSQRVLSPAPGSERWVIRNPTGALAAVLREAGQTAKIVAQESTSRVGCSA